MREVAGKSVRRPDLGEIELTRRGLKHLLSRIGGPFADDQLTSVLRLPEALQNGKYIGMALPYSGTHAEVRCFHYINWEPRAGLLLRITIKEFKYSHGGKLSVYDQHAIIKNGR